MSLQSHRSETRAKSESLNQVQAYKVTFILKLLVILIQVLKLDKMVSIPMTTYSKKSVPTIDRYMTGKTEDIDPFLLSLRFFGFDLCVSRYQENSGKREFWRNSMTKFLLFIAISLVNVQTVIHIVTTLKGFSGKRFYDLLNDLRSLMLKLTMAFAVDLWFINRKRRAQMTHMIINSFIQTDSSSLLKKLTIKWTVFVIGITFVHWSASQFWLSTLSIQQYRKWLLVVNCTGDRLPEVLIHLIATLDSFVYRMYTYGSRFAVMCAYSLMCILLSKCVKQLNQQLVEQLDNGSNSLVLDIEAFKRQFNLIYRMHLEIEHCFGPLNFVWFSTLFVVSCIDIFFLAWSAGSEWFQVWSLMEFMSMIILWLPHFIVSHFASQVSLESKQLKLNLKELCRDNERVRKLIVTPSYYPRMKPTLNNVVTLDSEFFLSFICTLATFSVMMIQLNPEAIGKIG